MGVWQSGIEPVSIAFWAHAAHTLCLLCKLCSYYLLGLRKAKIPLAMLIVKIGNAITVNIAYSAEQC